LGRADLDGVGRIVRRLFLREMLADRHPSPRVLGAMLTIGSVYVLLLPWFDEPVLQFFARHIDDVITGKNMIAVAAARPPSLVARDLLAIRLLLPSRDNSGAVSRTVYGVSTAGCILGGVLGTLFFLFL